MFGISLYGPDDPSKPACRCQPSVLRRDVAFYALLMGWSFFVLGCELVRTAKIPTGVLGVIAGALLILWGYSAADRKVLRQGSFVIALSALLVNSAGYTEGADASIIVALSAAFGGGVLLFILSFFKKEGS